MVELVINNGVKHIQVDDVLVPVADMLEACTAGVFDKCGDQFSQVVRLYLDSSEAVTNNCMMPLFRQIVARETERWVGLRYGIPEWRHKQVRMPVDVSIVRTAFMHQIEGALATVKDGAPLQEKARLFYQGMLSLPESHELSDFGKETVTELFDSMLEGFVENGLEIPTRH